MLWTRLALVAVLAVGGCASISPQECETGDWVAIGARDGQEGRVPDAQFPRHVQACEKLGITPDRALWDRGYQAGLQRYCTPLSGLREGEAGNPYRNVCPQATEAGFVEGHALGRRAHRARADVAQIESDMRSLRDRIALAIRAKDPAAASGLELEALSLRLDLGLAQARLDRIERDIAQFRAAHR